MKTSKISWVLIFGLLAPVFISAQQITGVWKGKIKSNNLELKLIKSGDSLVGTSYYYLSKNNYRRYSVKGYFDPETNAVIWWDDALIDEKTGRSFIGTANDDALLSVADFNCPGEGKMVLDGSSTLRDDKDITRGPVHLQKVENPVFIDEWDFVIDNYTVGANHPFIIDSVAHLNLKPQEFPEEKIIVPATPGSLATAPTQKPVIVVTTPAPLHSTNEQKFATRKNVLQTVIPITARTIELRFYDNASIDGDSIALFLNGKLLKEHILLTGEPQTIKLNAEDLGDDNELVMVAENLGTIPPNTSYMICVVGNKQYEARLYADNGKSALVRFIKQ